MRRALDFPAGSVTHLAGSGQGLGEMAVLAALERAGLPLGMLALPDAVEDSFYRYNNLPPRLAALYRDVDPADPDEDLLEEAEAAAMALVEQSYLLDEVIDAIYQGLAGLPGSVVVRRPGDRAGSAVNNGRPVLLALKHQFRSDWTADAVFARLLAGFGIGVDARPMLVHERPAGTAPASTGRGPARGATMAELVADAAASAEASRVLGRSLSVAADARGRIVGVLGV